MSCNILSISIIESIYLLYMFIYFKTKINFNILLGDILSSNYKNLHKFLETSTFLKHSLTDDYNNKICNFGHVIIIPFIIYLILRNFILSINKYHTYMLYMSFILSLMNINALIYLLPIWIIEFIC